MRAAQPALSPARIWPISFPSQGWDRGPTSLLGPPSCPFSFPFSTLPRKSVADPLPWELGLAGAAQSSPLAQHHVGFPRKLHNSWQSVESRVFFGTRLPESSESKGCSKGARVAAGRGEAALPAEAPRTQTGQSQPNVRGKVTHRL